MKINKIIPTLISLFILVSCVEDLPNTSMVKTKQGSTYMSLRSTEITLPSDELDVKSITLNTLRILVFNENGQIVTNESFDISNKTAVKKEGENTWSIDLSDIKVITSPGPSTVYVVLNEDVSKVSGQSLTTALEAITSLTGTDLTAMEYLVKTPLSYTTLIRVTYKEDGVTPNEPPFVMVTFDEINILPNRSFDNPNVLDLRGSSENQKGFELDRSMAKITIKGISNKDFYGNELSEELQLETGNIFILEIGLVNVPTQYSWAPNRVQTTSPGTNPYNVPLSPYNGTYQGFNYPRPLPDMGYYERNWTGNIRFDFTTEGYMIQTKDARVWWTGQSLGSGGYSLDRGALDATIGTKFNTSKEYYDKYNGAKPPILQLNSGNWPSWALEKLADTNLPFGPTQYHFNNPDFTPIVTAGSWSLNEKNISFYVPEHILANSDDPSFATKLRIKAVKVPPPTNISPEESERIIWNNPTWGNWEYAVVPGQPVTQALLDSLWWFERDTYTYTSGGKTYTYPIIRHFWHLGYRTAKGTNTGTVDGIQFKNISSTPESETKVFYLPIKNNVGDVNNGVAEDYNIYRNHEYKLSVHVLKSWQDETRSASATSAKTSTRNSWENPEESMVLRIVTE